MILTSPGFSPLTCLAKMCIRDRTRRQCAALSTHLSNLLQERGDRAVYRIVHFMGYGAYLEEHGMDGSRADILEAIGANQPTPLALLERLEELEQVVRAGEMCIRDRDELIYPRDESKEQKTTQDMKEEHIENQKKKNGLLPLFIAVLLGLIIGIAVSSSERCV